MKKFLSILLLVAMALSLSACGGGKSSGSAAATELGFSDAVSLDTITKLKGEQVTIIGYMATMSPISGKYMYLMNMPYQSCPFCLPNTNQLTNTMAVYAPDGKTFDYTDQAIRVTGTMVIDDIVDEFGYAYNYYISDASYEVVDMSTVSEEYALWQYIASDGIVTELNSMFDYLYFLSQWTEYQGSYEDENGQTISYYMYPGDVEQYLTLDNGYGYAKESAEDYFPGLISRIRAISADGLEDLVAIVEAAKAHEQFALGELNSGAYTYDEATDKFTLDNAETLYNRFYEVYGQFAEWLALWEL